MVFKLLRRHFEPDRPFPRGVFHPSPQVRFASLTKMMAEGSLALRQIFDSRLRTTIFQLPEHRFPPLISPLASIRPLNKRPTFRPGITTKSDNLRLAVMARRQVVFHFIDQPEIGVDDFILFLPKPF